MALHDDLLEQAQHLLSREQRRPRQASLRRAVSNAYYAVFHLLIDAATRRFIPREPAQLRGIVGRAFNHAEMKDVCKQFASGRLESLPEATRSMMSRPLEPQLIVIGASFVELQQARHSADYDLAAKFSRLDTRQHVELARQVFADWRVIGETANATVFLASLLHQRRWGR